MQKAHEMSPEHSEVFFLQGLMHLLQVLFSAQDETNVQLHLSEATRLLLASTQYTFGATSLLQHDQFMALGVAFEAADMNDLALRHYTAALMHLTTPTQSKML
uniref:30S ribosomal protein S2, chloroplastic n=1 Tax=Lygus hesperus TaxID=30085 RepID=A0A0A9WQT7_LYGHE